MPLPTTALLSRVAAPPGGRGLVAVSGGPDSVALLRLLHALGLDLHVGHLNHTLRGADSDADAAFVQALAEQLAVPCHVAVLPVAAQAAATGANLEAAARQLRYRWLADRARTIGAAWVATGHTTDDQAETVLFHVLRGTGLRGLRGIAPARRLTAGVWLVRPLLHVRRAELLCFLEELGQLYRVDRSNTDLRFTRNRLRHEVLPFLERTVQPQAAHHLAHLAAQARWWQRAVNRRAQDLLRRSALPRAGAMVILNASRLGKAPRWLVAEMLIRLFEREGWPRGRMSARHWEQAAAVCRGQAQAADLPEGLVVRRQGQVIQVSRQTS